MAIEVFGPDTTQAPVSTVDGWGSDTAMAVGRNEDYNHQGENDPYSAVGEGLEPLPDSYYQDWEEERAYNTFAGIYLDDETKAELFSILNGRGGYFMLSGLIKAHENGTVRIGADRLSRTQGKITSQLSEISGILTSSIDSIPTDKQSQKIEEIIQAFKDRYSGDHNRAGRLAEKTRLSRIGGAALKHAS